MRGGVVISIDRIMAGRSVVERGSQRLGQVTAGEWFSQKALLAAGVLEARRGILVGVTGHEKDLDAATLAIGFAHEPWAAQPPWQRHVAQNQVDLLAAAQ